MPHSISSTQIENLVRKAATALFRTDAYGTPVEFSGWSAMTGQEGAEVTDGGWLDAVHGDDRERAMHAWETSVDHGTEYNTEFRVRAKDGSFHWMNARAVAIFDENGNVSGWVGMMLPVPGVRREPSAVSGGAADDIAPGALRAARAMLNWSAEEMAQTAGISRSTVRRMESEEENRSIHRNTAALVIQALRGAGLDLLVQDGTVNGVRLKPAAASANVVSFPGGNVQSA